MGGGPLGGHIEPGLFTTGAPPAFDDGLGLDGGFGFDDGLGQSLGAGLEPGLFTGAAPAFQHSPDGLGPMGGLGYEESPFDASTELGMDTGPALTCFKCGKPMYENSDSVLPVCSDCQSETAGFDPPGEMHEEPPTMANIPNDDLLAGGPIFDDDLYGTPLGDDPYGPPPTAAEDPYGPPPGAIDYIPTDGLPPEEPEPFSHAMEEVEELDLSGGEGRLDPTWIKIRKLADGQEVGPISLAEVRSLYVHGKITFDDEYSGQDGVWYPIHQVPELLVILRRTPQLGSGKGEGKSKSSGAGQGLLLWLLALLLLGGGGGTAWLIWYNSSKNKTKKANGKNLAKVPPNRLLKEKINQWKQQNPSIKPSPKESKALSAKGWGELIQDQPKAYTQAITAFTQAMVADPKNDKALAGYCLATAWSPSRVEASARKQSECGAILKLKRKGTAIVRSVYALYLFRRGVTNKAQRLARKAAKKSKKDGWGQLLYAEILSLRQRSTKRILQALKRALKQNDKLARAHLRMAELTFKQQHYATAIKHLKPLVEAQHPKGMYLQSIYQQSVGQFGKSAKTLAKLLEANPKHLKSWMTLAILRYQFLGQRKKAYEQLLKPPALGPGQDLPKFFKKKRLLHLATIELAMNKPKLAKEHLDKLHKLDRNYLPAKFLQVQYLAFRKDYQRAYKSMASIKDKLSGDRFHSYNALLQMKKGDVEGAAKELRRLMDEHAGSIWPRLLLPTAYFKQKKRDLALVVMKKALDVEPRAEKNQARSTDFYFLPAIWLDIMREYLRLKVSREEKALTISAAGIFAYHLNQTRTAFTYLRRSRGIDRNGLASNLYLAQYHLDRKQYRQAKRYAQRVYQNYNQHPVSALILAWIAYHKKQYAAAEKLFQTVRKERPWFISPKIGEALALGKSKQKEDAFDILKKLLSTQQSNHLLARALLTLKW